MASSSSTASSPGERAQTLQRGLQILEALTAGSLPIGRLSAKLGIHRSIVTRLLLTLDDADFVSRDPSGAYRLGPALLELARAVEAPVRMLVRPLLEGLAERLGTTAVLTVIDGDDALCVEAVEPRRTHMHIAYRPGLRHRLDQAASGMAILSAMAPLPDERHEVTEARLRGWAVSEGEIQLGVMGVAVPISLPDRPEPASVGIIGLREALDVDAAVVALRQTVAELPSLVRSPVRSSPGA